MSAAVFGELEGEQKRFEEFVRTHGDQLSKISFPPALMLPLFRKLETETFDAGTVVSFAESDSPTGYSVVAITDIPANSDVFLIDHAWSTTFASAASQLRSNPALLERMENLFCLTPPSNETSCLTPLEESSPSDELLPFTEVFPDIELSSSLTSLVLDDRNLTDAQLLHWVSQGVFTLQTPLKLEELSLWGNRIAQPSTIVQIIIALGCADSLKGLWLNANPVTADASLSITLTSLCPRLEILNSKFTERFDEWAVTKANNGVAMETATVLDLSGRDIARLDSTLCRQWQRVRRLDLRGNPRLARSLYSSDEYLKILRSIPRLVELFVDMPDELDTEPVAAERLEECRRRLFDALPQLRVLNDRTRSEKEMTATEKQLERRVDAVWRRMWLHNGSYYIKSPTLLGGGQSAADEDPADDALVWYVMDELGSRVDLVDSHLAANVALYPFFYLPRGAAYSILWPLADMPRGTVLARCPLPRTSLVDNGDSALVASLRLAAGFGRGENVDALFAECDARYGKWRERMRAIGAAAPTVRVRVADEFPKKEIRRFRRPLRVFTDIELVREFLTRSEFVHVDSPEAADVLWLYGHFVGWRELSEKNEKVPLEAEPPLFVNQFPKEECVVVKDLLAKTVTNVFGDYAVATLDRPRTATTGFFPESFNMESELAEFVGAVRCHGNRTWIAKPWNLSRGMGMVVSDELSCLVRQMDTGPKVVSTYVDNPAVFRGRKFDMRFIVLLRRIGSSENSEIDGGLEVFVYNVFWLRFANREFSLNRFDQYARHFTVMNYLPQETLTQIHFNEFVPEFEKQYNERVAMTTGEPGTLDWYRDVMPRIYHAIKGVFVAGQRGGIEPCAYSRAIYGIDMMLDEDLNPVILEVNFCPDCKRACKYHPMFFNDIFGVLFLEEDNNERVTRI